MDGSTEATAGAQKATTTESQVGSATEVFQLALKEGQEIRAAAERYRAEVEADAIKRAETIYNQIVSAAQQAAEEIKRRAVEEARQIITEVNQQRAEAERELAESRAKVSELEATYKHFLEDLWSRLQGVHAAETLAPSEPAISPEPTKGAPQEKAPKGRRFLAALFGRPQEEAKPTAAPPVVETREPLRPVEAAPTAKPELQGVAETITPTEPAPPTKGKGKILHQGKVDLILPSTVDWRLTQKLKDDLEKMPTVKVEGTTGSAKGETVLTILLEEPLPIIEMLHALPEVAEIVRWEKPRTVLAAAREGRDTFPLRLTIGLREIAKEQPMITEAPPQELSSPPPLTPTRAKTVEAPPPITEILAGIVAQEPSVPGEPLQPPPSVAPGPLPVLEAGLYQGRVELQVTPLQNIAELMKFQTILATLPDVPGLSISDVLSLENGLGATFFLNLTMPIPLAATLVQSIPGIRLQKGPNRIVAELPEHW